MILASSFGNKENFKIINVTKNKRSKIILKKYFKDFPLTLVIQKFNKDLEDTVNIIDIYYELFINQLVSELVIIDKIPFYLLNICNFPSAPKTIPIEDNISSYEIFFFFIG